MEIFVFSAFLFLPVSVRGSEMDGGEVVRSLSSPIGVPENRQEPLCGMKVRLSSGQSSPLVSMNHPYNYPSVHYCNWKFSCPSEMTLRCSDFDLPDSPLCWQSAFLYGDQKLCGSSTALENPVNVGKNLTAILYGYLSSSSGFNCTITCGQSTNVSPPPASTSPTTPSAGPPSATAHGTETPSATPPPPSPTSPPPSPAPPPSQPCVCGISGSPPHGKKSKDRSANSSPSDTDRVLGSIPVPYAGKYPWMAYFSDSGEFCGGSLINDRYVLTAAQCVDQSLSETFYVNLGDLDWSITNESKSIRIPARAIIHPRYDSVKGLNDIALLKLKTPVNFNEFPHIRPICIASNAIPVPGQTC
ncbi:unnamed protein product, partial [Darwinula stevensoni]